MKSRTKPGLGVESIEIWFQDEARIGQKNKITRRWAGRGTRPSRPRDQRTASTYIFGVAVCTKEGKGGGSDTARLQYRGDESAPCVEIAAAIATSAHAVLIVEKACWHVQAPCRSTQHQHSFRCRQSALSSTQSKTSGSSCVTTGSRTASSNPTTISSIIAGRPGTSSQITTVAHHVHRIAPMGPWVLINGICIRRGLVNDLANEPGAHATPQLRPRATLSTTLLDLAQNKNAAVRRQADHHRIWRQLPCLKQVTGRAAPA